MGMVKLSHFVSEMPTRVSKLRHSIKARAIWSEQERKSHGFRYQKLSSFRMSLNCHFSSEDRVSELKDRGVVVVRKAF